MIVATLDRREELDAFFRSIPRKQAQRIEFVVVDQNEARFLGEEVWQAANGLSIKRITVSFQNASRARNLGATLATTEWISFPDDDCTLLEGTLASALPLIERDSFDLISGQVVEESGRPHLLDWLKHDAPITPRNLDRTLVESAFFVRRAAFLSVGGFDPAFGPGADFESAEGADLVRRLWVEAPHLRTWFTPTVAIYHPDKQAERTTSARLRIYRFARGEGAFVARHWRELALYPIARKLVSRTMRGCASVGETRRRKWAYLRGFFTGLRAYRVSHLGCQRLGSSVTRVMTTPTFSLIIATVGRSDDLRACLKSLERERLRDFEVILVDQNQDDRVVSMVAEFRESLPVEHFRYPLRNASLARNAGAQRARGEWIGFPDDDCQFTSSTLDALRREVARGDVDLVAGKVCDPFGDPVMLNWYPAACSITNAKIRRTVAESSLYVRRSLFEVVGGFDEAFGPGGIFYSEEGVDLVRRLWAEYGAGVKMRYSPAICLVHRNVSWYADASAVQRAHRYSLGRGALFARHWKQASFRRAFYETAKHLVGSIILRGHRRSSRIESLLGNVEGFAKYHRWEYERRRRARGKRRKRRPLMRVNYVAPADRTGYAQAAAQYITLLTAQGVHVSFQPLLPGGKGGGPRLGLGYELASPVEVANPSSRSLAWNALQRDADTVLHVVPEYYPGLARWLRASGHTGRRIGMTVWETSRIPKHWPPLLNALDGIIVPSTWNAEVFSRCGVRVPISVVAHASQFAGVSPADQVVEWLGRRLPGVAGKFIFYSIGTWDARKGNDLLLQAFALAFSERSDAVLILKTTRKSVQGQGGWWRKKQANVIFLTEELSDDELAALHTLGDCYVSCSRGEGWGLGIYEAVLFGKPVLVPEAGGHRAYLAEHGQSGLIRSRWVGIRRAHRNRSYTGDQQWVEVDVADAAEKMLRMVNGVTGVRDEAAAMAAYVRQRFAPETITSDLMRVLKMQ